MTAVLAMAAYLNMAHTDWDTKLQGAALAVNTTRQSTTEVTPFELVYGRRPVMAQENKFPWPPESPELYEVFAKRVAEMREAVGLKIIEKLRKVKDRVDRSRRVTRVLRVGELVLVKRNLIKKGKTKKLLSKFVGPYQVVKKVCETTYLVEDLPARRKKKSLGDSMPMCVKTVVHARDDVEWKVEEDSDTDEEGNSEPEERSIAINNTQEPEENVPSIAVSEAVGEKNESEMQPREPEKTRSGRQTRPR